MEGGDIIAISSKRSTSMDSYWAPVSSYEFVLLSKFICQFERGLALLVAPQGESISKGGSAATVDVHKKIFSLGIKTQIGVFKASP